MTGTRRSRDAQVDCPGNGQVWFARWPLAFYYLWLGFVCGSQTNWMSIVLEISYFQTLAFISIHCVLFLISTKNIALGANRLIRMKRPHVAMSGQGQSQNQQLWHDPKLAQTSTLGSSTRQRINQNQPTGIMRMHTPKTRSGLNSEMGLMRRPNFVIGRPLRLTGDRANSLRTQGLMAVVLALIFLQNSCGDNGSPRATTTEFPDHAVSARRWNISTVRSESLDALETYELSVVANGQCRDTSQTHSERINVAHHCYHASSASRMVRGDRNIPQGGVWPNLTATRWTNLLTLKNDGPQGSNTSSTSCAEPSCADSTSPVVSDKPYSVPGQIPTEHRTQLPPALSRCTRCKQARERGR